MNNRPTYIDASGFKNEAQQAFGPQVKGSSDILETLSPSNVCQECATANSSKDNDTQSEHESGTATLLYLAAADWEQTDRRTAGGHTEEDRTLTGSRGRFSAALEDAKIQEHTCHCTHRTFTSRLVMAEMVPRTIAELYGHRALQMVMRHSHLAPEHQASAADRLVSFGNTRDTTVNTGEFGVKRCKTPKHAIH